jgi:hypothetical protein
MEITGADVVIVKRTPLDTPHHRGSSTKIKKTAFIHIEAADFLLKIYKNLAVCIKRYD